MKKILSLFLLATTVTSGVFAQVTNDVDVSRGSHAPLYDCSIYNFSEDRGACYEVKNSMGRISWENQGYAVNCYDAGLRRRQRELCLDLADRVLSNTHTLNCMELYRDRYAQRQCEITKRGYEDGRFNSNYVAPAPVVRPVPAPAPVVVREERFVADEQYRDVCGPEAYDRNYNRWLEEKERLEKRGRERAIGGAIATGLGIILGGSRDSGTRAVGTLLTVGGVVVMVAGAVDLNEAKMSLPHVNPACRQYYVPEVRMVTYEREVCKTTQWTERGWGYSRSYYEVQCNTRTYVSYERDFRPWHSGRPYRY